MPRKLTKEEFIERATQVHNGKYDYSKVDYVNVSTKVCIICPIHGEFWQRAGDHMLGRGCRICSNNFMDTNIFIEKANKKYNNKYDYSKTKYIDEKTKVIVTCPFHGDFLVSPNNHLNGTECHFCKKISHKRLLCGVGLFDIEGDSRSRAGQAWSSMMKRCYDLKEQEKHPTYKGCSVCEEWHTYSNFKKWFEDPENGYREGHEIDKDILVKGNKIYSPEFCCLVPARINTLVCKSRKGILGVYATKRGTFMANMAREGRHRYIGIFATKEEAFNAYKEAKETYIKEVAMEYFSRGEITKKVYQTLMNYEVEYDD